MANKRTYSITIPEAEQHLKKACIIPLNGHVYNLYTCGHAFDLENDSQRLTYYEDKHVMNRSCPKCDCSPLIVKYKQCACGHKQIGYSMQITESCMECSSRIRRELKKLKKASPTAHYYNEKLADSKRWDCVNRDDCLTKFSKHHRAIPCKDCPDYELDKKWIGY